MRELLGDPVIDSQRFPALGSDSVPRELPRSAGAITALPGIMRWVARWETGAGTQVHGSEIPPALPTQRFPVRTQKRTGEFQKQGYLPSGSQCASPSGAITGTPRIPTPGITGMVSMSGNRGDLQLERIPRSQRRSQRIPKLPTTGAIQHTSAVHIPPWNFTWVPLWNFTLERSLDPSLDPRLRIEISLEAKTRYLRPPDCEICRGFARVYRGG